jgi:DNA repair exonuclease SbcCD ATPase subunit
VQPVTAMEEMGHGGGSSIQQMNLEDVSPATRLLEKRRQMFEVQEALETQKEEFARREELFKRREDALRKQDLELQQQLIRFNKFLQENDSKTARADKKAKEETHLRQQKEQEILEKTRELEELVNKKDEMKAILDKNLVYEKYLTSVVEEADDFQEIGELLKRHETLKAHHRDLQERAEEVALLNDQYRNELQAYMKEGQDTKLKGHNDIAQYQKLKEQEELKSLVADNSREGFLDESAKRVLECGKCQMVITNLYERSRSNVLVKGKVKSAFTSDQAEQLKVIGEFVSDLSIIIKTVNNSMNAKLSATGKVRFSFARSCLTSSTC